MIRANYFINHPGIRFHQQERLQEKSQEKFSLNIVKDEIPVVESDSSTINNTENTCIINSTEEFFPPIPPNKFDYTQTITDSNGLKETVLDETAFEQAMEMYFQQKADYDAQINTQNQETAKLQKQDLVNNMNEEWSLFNQRLNELNTELETNGTGSKMMTNIMHELSAEYAELLQNRLDENIKIVDNISNNMNIPNPPVKTDSTSDEEYDLMLKRYNLEKLSYEKLQLEQEIQKQSSELKIAKMDKELEIIRRLLFGNADLTKQYYDVSN